MEITYLKNIQKGYIVGAQTIEKKVVIAPSEDKDNCVEVIDKDEYDNLLKVFKTAPQAEEGYKYGLKRDLTWEKYELQKESSEKEENDAVNNY